MAQRGLSIVELLVAITIAAILLGAAVPSMRMLVAESQLDATMRRLHASIQLTRTAAVQFRRIATLCPQGGRLDAARRHCGADWSAGYHVFVDRNGDAMLDTDIDTLLLVEPPDDAVRLSWRAFRRRAALQFRADGATHLSNGTFTLCSARVASDSLDHVHGGVRRLVINVGGRTRTERNGEHAALCD